jgi:hypothetical protein
VRQRDRERMAGYANHQHRQHQHRLQQIQQAINNCSSSRHRRLHTQRQNHRPTAHPPTRR